MSVSSLINSVGGYVNDSTIKFDPDRASVLSANYGKIAASLDNASHQIEGALSEVQGVWSGEAAENFMDQLKTLMTKTKEISEAVSANKNQIDSAAENLIKISEQIREEPKGKPPVLLGVICGLSNASYQRPDGVYVIPITALKD